MAINNLAPSKKGVKNYFYKYLWEISGSVRHSKKSEQHKPEIIKVSVHLTDYEAFKISSRNLSHVPFSDKRKMKQKGHDKKRDPLCFT